MKKAFTWCYIFTKRQLKRASTIFILVTMLLLTIALSVMSTTMTASMDVGFYIDSTDNDAIMIGIKNGLLKHDGLLNFVAYDSTDTLNEDVTAGTIQCGYIFDDNFSEAIVSGNTKNMVELVETPDNIVSLLSNVVILATVMEQSACDMLIEDILTQDFFVNVPDKDLEVLRDTYNTFATNGSTFAFDYDTLYEDYKGSSNSIDIAPYLVTPVKGIIAIFIFISALTGGIGWFNDSDSATYANIPLKKRYLLRLLTISIPTFLASLMGYISILSVGIGTNALYELFAIFAYEILCIAFSYILSLIVKKNIYSSLIPVFILGSIVCCPIFFNLGNLVPSLRVLQNIFLPTYYFMLF